MEIFQKRLGKASVTANIAGTGQGRAVDPGTQFQSPVSPIQKSLAVKQVVGDCLRSWPENARVDEAMV